MEGSVLGSKILPAILIVVPATVLLTAQACLSEPAAEECVSRPTAITPRGAHWYYRINRAKQHCWYLGKADGRFGTAEWKCRRSACCRSAGGNVSGGRACRSGVRACASGANASRFR